VTDNFIPERVHVKEQAADFKRLGTRYGAEWTPATLIFDLEGEERHRIEGFLPADEFSAQLMLGLAQVAFHAKQFADAERRFREVVMTYPDTDAAPEALYWAGVASYKATHNGAALSDTYRAFTQRYQDSAWAKKASVWNPEAQAKKAG
jgi:hypothetical protein